MRRVGPRTRPGGIERLERGAGAGMVAVVVLCALSAVALGCSTTRGGSPEVADPSGPIERDPEYQVPLRRNRYERAQVADLLERHFRARATLLRRRYTCVPERDYICVLQHDPECQGLPSCPPQLRLERHLEGLRDAADDARDDPFVLGQAVFAHVLAGEYERAARLVRECGAHGWICAMLEGYLLAEGGPRELAETAFDRALARMPMNELCADWTDLSDLVDPGARRWYSSLICDERLEANRTIWWLADPLHLVEGNERRREHLRRIAYLRLHDSGLERRWTRSGDLHNAGPGGAFGGHDREHQEEALRFGRTWTSPRIEANRAFDPFEGRYPFFPREAALDDPLRSAPEDFRLERTPYTESHAPDHREYADLPHQVAVFDRGAGIEVLAAVEPPSRFASSPDERLVGLALSTGPETAPRVDRRVEFADRYLFRGRYPRRRYLASLEMISAAPWAARARFGIGLPEGRSSRVRTSDLLLFEPGASSPETLTEAAGKMLPRTVLPAGGAVGIFWGVYGAGPGEVLGITLRLEADRGLLGPVGRALGVFDEEVTVSWRDVRPEEGGLIWGRAFVLELDDVGPGDYRVRLTVDAVGQPPFEVVRKVVVR